MKHLLYQRKVKRVLDIIFSCIGLVIFIIPMIIISIAIKIDSPGPVVFKQERLGRYGRIYIMYKFRTMCVGAEQMSGGVYSDNGDSRVSRVGKFLRATSLDEIPQLWNVLIGDCSLIGFRSPLTYHPWTWDKYTDEQKKMFELRPGITGWAQVNGRRTVEWNERIAMNIWYAENCSFGLDVKILFMTILKVLKNADNENIGVTVKHDKDV